MLRCKQILLSGIRHFLSVFSDIDFTSEVFSTIYSEIISEVFSTISVVLHISK